VAFAAPNPDVLRRRRSRRHQNHHIRFARMLSTRASNHRSIERLISHLSRCEPICGAEIAASWLPHCRRWGFHHARTSNAHPRHSQSGDPHGRTCRWSPHRRQLLNPFIGPRSKSIVLRRISMTVDNRSVSSTDFSTMSQMRARVSVQPIAFGEKVMFNVTRFEADVRNAPNTA